MKVHPSPLDQDTCSKFIALLTDNQVCIFDWWNELFARFLACLVVITCLVNILTVVIVKVVVKRPSVGATGKKHSL